MSRPRIYGPYEAAPCGAAGALSPLCWGFNSPRPDLSGCLVARVPPGHNLVIWEKIPTKAPGPHLTLPWCCYTCTVILYHRPFILRPPRWYRSTSDGVLRRDSVGTFYEWDRQDSLLNWHSLIEFESEIWEIGGGGVRWHRPHWWWMHRARRHVPKHGQAALKVAA